MFESFISDIVQILMGLKARCFKWQYNQILISRYKNMKILCEACRYVIL